MSVIITKSVSKLEPAMRAKAYAFLEKLNENDALPGLHIEPIQNSVDSRVRTGRVDQGYRAVLFQLTTPQERRLRPARHLAARRRHCGRQEGEADTQPDLRRSRDHREWRCRGALPPLRAVTPQPEPVAPPVEPEAKPLLAEYGYRLEDLDGRAGPGPAVRASGC